MKIVIHNLYGFNDGSKAYFRKQGAWGFDFVNKKEYASDLTEQECAEIKEYADWYCIQYRASYMTVEE